MTFTTEQVLKALDDHFGDPDERGEYYSPGLDTDWGDIEYAFNGREYNPETKQMEDVEPGLMVEGTRVPVKVVDTTGGMDEGSHASVTFQLGEQFFKKEGYYQSHYGYDWDGDFYEVKPVEKVVTVYEAAN